MPSLRNHLGVIRGKGAPTGPDSPVANKPLTTGQVELIKTPTELAVPSYVMNTPFTLSVDDPNNVWMKKLPPEKRKLDKEKAFAQWLQLYNFIAGESLTYLVPSLGQFQDQVYVANLAAVMPHVKKPTVVMANMKSPPRQGEEFVGAPFFEMMKYRVIMAPHYFEGEAELKWLGKNNYAGGWGTRSDKRTYEWMNDKLGANVIPIKETDEHLYHLDCTIFPLTREKTLVYTGGISASEVKALEKVTEIIPVTKMEAHNGMTNSVRVHGLVLCASNLTELKISDKDYEPDKRVVERLTKICIDNALEPVFFNLSEFNKSGAALSCCVMHLNYVDYADSNF